MANPSHGAVGGSTSDTSGGDVGGSTNEAVAGVGGDNLSAPGPVDTGPVDNEGGKTGDDLRLENADDEPEDAETLRAEDISKPRRDRKAALGEVRQWHKPVFETPDQSEWTDEAKELWDLQNPKGDRPVAAGEILDDSTDYGYERDQVEVEVGRTSDGTVVTRWQFDLEEPADPYHQSPTPDRSQATGSGERLLCKFLGPETQTRALYRDEIRSQLGADVDYDLVWSKGNNHTVDITDCPQELQDYLVVGDGLMAVTRVAVGNG